MYYRGSEAVIICFDVTNRESLNSAWEWVKEVQNNLDMKETLIIFVGNKADDIDHM